MERVAELQDRSQQVRDPAGGCLQPAPLGAGDARAALPSSPLQIMPLHSKPLQPRGLHGQDLALPLLLSAEPFSPALRHDQ